MRERAVGGYEPDDDDQKQLVELWHLSRTAIALPGAEREVMLAKHGSERSWRLDWVVNTFLAANTGELGVSRKWIYVWSVDNLGTATR